LDAADRLAELEGPWRVLLGAKLQREQGRDRLQVVAHAMVHLLHERRLGLDALDRLLIEAGIVDRDRRGVTERLQEPELLLVQCRAGTHAEADRANGLA